MKNTLDAIKTLDISSILNYLCSQERWQQNLETLELVGVSDEDRITTFFLGLNSYELIDATGRLVFHSMFKARKDYRLISLLLTEWGSLKFFGELNSGNTLVNECLALASRYTQHPEGVLIGLFSSAIRKFIEFKIEAFIALIKCIESMKDINE